MWFSELCSPALRVDRTRFSATDPTLSAYGTKQWTGFKQLIWSSILRGLTLPFPLRYRNKFAFLRAMPTVRPVRLVA
jgi:hypothetical protein